MLLILSGIGWEGSIGYVEQRLGINNGRRLNRLFFKPVHAISLEICTDSFFVDGVNLVALVHVIVVNDARQRLNSGELLSVQAFITRPDTIHNIKHVVSIGNRLGCGPGGWFEILIS
jgi:hypothetical protein